MNFNLKNPVSIMADRTVMTGVIASAMILVMGLFRPDESSGLNSHEYWVRKVAWHHCADMVLGGDSRVAMGLAPAEIAKTAEFNRIYNYGFGDAWYSREYLEEIETILDPASESRVIVLGISPRSLTKRNEKTADFFKEYETSKYEQFIQTHIGEILSFLRPLSFHEILPEIFPSLDDEYVMTELFADGWISTHKHPGKISRELKKYREYYKKYKVYEGNIKNVFAAVSQWSGGNIKVYGFIPPSCKEMYDMESEISGFNEKDFVTRFKKAGGVWLDVDPSAYYSFDGCHLQSDAAMEFSRDLGEMISNLDDNVASAN